MRVAFFDYTKDGDTCTELLQGLIAQQERHHEKSFTLAVSHSDVSLLLTRMASQGASLMLGSSLKVYCNQEVSPPVGNFQLGHTNNF